MANDVNPTKGGEEDTSLLSPSTSARVWPAFTSEVEAGSSSLMLSTTPEVAQTSSANEIPVTLTNFDSLPSENSAEIRLEQIGPTILRLRYDEVTYSLYCRRYAMQARKQVRSTTMENQAYEVVEADEMVAEKNLLADLECDIFYIQPRLSDYQGPVEPDHDQRKAREASVVKYEKLEVDGLNCKSTKIKNLEEYDKDYNDYIMSERDDGQGWREYREYCRVQPDYWQRIKNLAVNLHLPPFNFPFGAENQTSFNGQTRLQNWARVAVCKFLNSAFESEGGLDFQEVRKLFLVVPEKESPKIKEARLKNNVRRQDGWAVLDLDSHYEVHNFRYSKNGERGFIPWRKASSNLIFTFEQMLLIELKIGDWFDHWRSESKREWKLLDFELVVADYEGRVA